MDPRCGRKTKHDYAEILTCLVIGYLVGRYSLRRCLAWSRRHIKWLQKYLELKNGIASVSTVSRLLSSIDEEMFCYALIEWVTEMLDTKGIHIAIDGKALRGGTEKIKDGKIPYILNAIDTVTGMVIAQLPISEKTNEMTAIPKLLELLNIHKSIITIDAIGTTQPIIDSIKNGGGHYLLTVKKSNPLTYEELKDIFEKLEKEKGTGKGKENCQYQSIYKEYMETYDSCEKNEKNRGRIEYRKLDICENAQTITMKENEPSIQTIGWLRQVRIPIEKDESGNAITPDLKTFLEKGSIRNPKITVGDALTDDVHQVGIISDLSIRAKEALEIKRSHWKIENTLHHVLDDVLREDHSSARKSKNNLAVIRKYVYNILKIACIHDDTGKGVQEMSDMFADDPDLIAKYVFTGIQKVR